MQINDVRAIDLKSRLEELKLRVLSQEDLAADNMKSFFDDKPAYIIFLSFSDGKSRACVCNGIGNSVESSWKNAVDKMNNKIKQLKLDPLWIKADLVKEIKEYSFNAFIDYVSNIKTNYFREGIALDENFNLAFLEQEVNANVFIYGNNESSKKQISWKNIMAHIKYNLGLNLELNEKSCKKVWLFSTIGFFHDGNDCLALNNNWLNNGRRMVKVIDENLLRSIIKKSSDFLVSQVNSSGKFRYGYFPCFDNEIPGYNTLRHASTTYSMIEAFEVTRDEKLGHAIISALDYLVNEGIELLEDKNGATAAFVVERTVDNEIKLGANATALLAFSKYTTVFNDRKYIQLMNQLAEGISYFQGQDGSFVHVLKFPDLSVKEEFRTVYYNGEAAFALMRFYAIDNNEKWVNMVEAAFEYFINNKYWRQKDHWLSYCSNELIKHKPERKYIDFNLKNASGILDFCLIRETTYPTLLELLMATYSMIEMMKRENYALDLLEAFDQKKLMDAIEHRAEHQLNGLYFPEVAMYFKAPQNILWSFYIRHHSFRSRIDDNEHNISGYCSYLRQIVIKNAMDKNVRCAFTSEELAEVLDGYWYTDQNHDDFQIPSFLVDYIVTGTGLIESPNTCFVAMSKETWLKGTGNSGHYRNIFSDSHTTLVRNYPKLKDKSHLVGIIAERPIAELRGILPQLIVKNPYDAIKILAAAARKKMADNGTIIAVTGAVGKSTTVNMLHCLLNDETDYISNINGHNSRTGVQMWLASVGRFDPRFKQQDDKPNVCTLEVAASALWMRSGGVCNTVRPHIGIITHIELTQYQQGSRNIHDVAITKSKICQGIAPGGKAVLFRAMPEFDFIKETVTGYGAVPVTYGETPDCDTYVKKYEFTIPTAGQDIEELFTDIDAIVLGEEISYRIGAIGKPVILNSLAALTAAKLAGFDIQKIAQKFAGFKGNKNTMQLSNCGGVCILDCSHNLEIPSIIAAFDMLKQIRQTPGSRKIVLLSRIVNMKELAPEFHLQLTEPIIESGFDKFFFHEPLDEFKYLINKIPEEISGGRHQTAEEVVKAVLDYIREGDSILVMGAPRGCDFGQVLDMLTEGILAKQAGKSQLLDTEILSDHVRLDTLSKQPSCVVYSLDSQKRLLESGDMAITVDEGTGHILILHLVLSLLSQGKVRLTDQVPMGELAWRERNRPNALSVSAEDSLSLKTLLDAYVTANSPDAIIALAHFIFKKANLRSAPYFKQICLQLSMDDKVAINLTGRKNVRYEQCFTVNDLEKIAELFFSLPLDALKPLNSTAAVHQNKTLVSDSILHSAANVISHYCFGESTYNAIVYARVREENLAVCICGARDAYTRDTTVCNMLQRLENPKNKDAQEEWIALDDTRGFSCITIAGDTYFGERYTRIRKAKGQDDALQKYGYSYSFEKLMPLLPETDYNIVNFEAVLTENQQSPYQAYYSFILDASPQETLNELKRRNINAVMLANNHSLDFGEFAGKQSRKWFIEKGFRTIGFGETVQEAEKPICFDGAGRQIILFNAYWYREQRHYISRHYAMGNNAGTACIADSLLRKMTEYKEKYPDAFIIFSPHWGTDFSGPHVLQRQIAQRAIDAGADCIIGHGAHIVSDYEWIGGKFVIYSIGNFVFNSNGEDFVNKNKPPIGYVSKLLVSGESIRLRLYPILTYNPTTFWQPYPLTEKQFDEYLSHHLDTQETISKHEIGRYLEFIL